MLTVSCSPSWVTATDADVEHLRATFGADVDVEDAQAEVEVAAEALEEEEAKKAVREALESARIVSVTEEEPNDPSDPTEGRAFWVTAKVGALRVRLYACPRHTTSGVDGLEPCGSFFEDWCDEALVTAFGEQGAREIGSELIARAEVRG